MTPNALQNLEAVNFTAELGSDSKKSPSYQATLSELVIHEAILRQALAAEPHPLGAHPSNRLDYRVYTDAANPLAFVEVTSIAPAEAWVASNNREARIYNAIDGINLPAGWRLSYSLDRTGSDSPAMGPVCRAIRDWVNAHAAGELHRGGRYGATSIGGPLLRGT